MLEYINNILSGMLVPLLLTVVGIYFGIKLRWFHLLHPMAVIRGLKSQRSQGGISSAGAVCLALAGTLGVGNIVGVSSAICLGGFGAVFWMWISALLAMLLKYAEIVLAMRHRKTSADGVREGSAMIYILDLFTSSGFKRLGKTVATIFSAAFLLNALTMGSMLQSGAIADALEGVARIPVLCTGAILATVTFFVVRRGTTSMTALTNILVPVMSVGYVILSLIVIMRNGSELGNAFYQIFHSAFSPSSAVSGIGGYLFTRSVRYGVMRGLISNEAGCGTAPTAHAVADCSPPARQGMWGIFEVFADTIVLCTMTALCVILEYGAASRFSGNFMMMTVSAYAARLGNLASYFMCVAVLCFGFATIICWAHYGLTCVRFFSKSTSAKKIFIAVYCLCVFAGTAVRADLAWQLADLSMGVMTVINLTVLVLMVKEVKNETELYLQ